MKIAMVFDGMVYGGIERIGLDYARMLTSQGNEVDIYILNSKEIEGIVDEFPEQCEIYRLNFSRYLCPESYWRVAVVYWWGKFVFPIVFIVLRFGLFLLKPFMRSKKKYDVSIAVSGHLNDLTYVSYNFIKANKKCCWLHGGLYGYMCIIPGFQRLYQKIKNLVVLTDLVQDEILFYNKYLDLNIRKIYNPSYIGLRTIDKNKVKELKDKYGDYALMVARMSPPKNPQSVIKAFEYIYHKYGLGYNVVFVGDGPDMEKVKAFASTTDVAKYCHFEGTQADPQNYYAAASVFTFSSFSEGLPTVLIEASYFGIPLISSDTSVREILGNNQYGLISPIDNHELLAENIYQVISSKEMYHKYSNLSKECFKRFEPECISEQLNDFLRNLR